MSLPMMKGLKMSEVKIEIAEAEDAEILTNISVEGSLLHRQLMPNYFRPEINKDVKLESFQFWIKSDDHVVFKALCDGKICGYLLFQTDKYSATRFINPISGYIGELCVSEKYRRKGIGRALMLAAEKYCQEQNIPAIHLNVYALNEAACKFYASLGYIDWEIDKRKFLK